MIGRCSRRLTRVVANVVAIKSSSFFDFANYIRRRLCLYYEQWSSGSAAYGHFCITVWWCLLLMINPSPSVAWPSRLDMISFLHRHRRFHSLTCLSMSDVITDLVQTEAKRSRTGVVARLLLQITICSQTTAESATTVSSIDPRPINSCLNWWKFIISHAHFIQERES